MGNEKNVQNVEEVVAAEAYLKSCFVEDFDVDSAANFVDFAVSFVEDCVVDFVAE